MRVLSVTALCLLAGLAWGSAAADQRDQRLEVLFGELKGELALPEAQQIEREIWRICTLIGEQNANISDLHFIDRKPDFFRLLIDMDVRDAEHLHGVLSALDAETDVAAVERYRDPSRSGAMQSHEP